MKQVIKDLLSPFYYMYSFKNYLTKATQLTSPSTRYKHASKHLYNQLTELLIEKCPLISLDLGGTMIKICMFIPDTIKTQDIIMSDEFSQYYLPELSFKAPCIDGTFLFFRFLTSQIKQVTKFLNKNNFPFDHKKVLRCTGGGAYKFKEYLLQNTNFKQIEIHDEIASLRSGMLFLTALKIKNELATQDDQETTDENSYEQIRFEFSPTKKEYPRNWVYPNLLVQIGSGTSFVKIDAEDYARLDGSAVGGATFVGMATAMIQDQEKHTYQQLMNFSQQGNVQQTTLSVGDIYGKSYSGLSANIPAAFFARNSTQQDNIAAAHQLICVNTAHLAVLHCKLHSLKKIVFSGGFLNKQAQNILQWAVKFYSGGQIECIFMWHDAVLGAIGALLGKEVEYIQAHDDLGEKVEEIVEQLENVDESEIFMPHLRWQVGLE